MSDDIIIRLRQEWEYGNNAKGCDYEMFAQAADEIERMRIHMDVLVDHNVELMEEVAMLKGVANGAFTSTTETAWKRDG
jgi:hypothetical protein